MNETTDQSNEEWKDYTDVTNWSDLQREKIKKEVNRTDCEAQKAENIVYAFLNVTTYEHGIMPDDIREEPDMDETDQLTFGTVDEKVLDNCMNNLTIFQTIDFIATAVTEYTDFDSFEADVSDIDRTYGFIARK